MNTFLREELAALILAGPLDFKSVEQRLQSGIKSTEFSGCSIDGNERRWIGKLAFAISIQFANRTVPPRHRRVAQVISNLPMPAAFEFCEVDLSAIALPCFEPRLAKFRDCDFPVINTPGELAAWLKLTVDQFNWLTRGTLRNGTEHRWSPYSVRAEPRSNGRRRLLEIPCPLLRSVQRQIHREILSRVPVHEAAHGFRSGRSRTTCIQPHIRQTISWKLDLEGYFLSIQRPRVFGLFRLLGYPESVADAFASLTTHAISAREIERLSQHLKLDQQLTLREWGLIRHLPQGAPSSPSIANLLTYRLDCRLSSLALKFSSRYTRYADDLLFSGDAAFRRNLAPSRALTMAIILNEGFHLQHQKSRVMPHSRRQHALGIVFNEKLNPPRKEYATLHAILFNCVRHGAESQNREGLLHFQEHLAGRIAAVAQLNPERAEKLKTLYGQISWT